MSQFVIAFDGFDPAEEGHREALCALGNGYLVTRGAAPEASADEFHYPGTYAAGVYNRLTTEIAGRRVADESLVNVPNWLPLAFRAEDGEWFGDTSCEVLDHRLELDMFRGTLTRMYASARPRRPHRRAHPTALREHARSPPRLPRDDAGCRELVGTAARSERARRHRDQRRRRAVRRATQAAPDAAAHRPGER